MSLAPLVDSAAARQAVRVVHDDVIATPGSDRKDGVPRALAAAVSRLLRLWADTRAARTLALGLVAFSPVAVAQPAGWQLPEALRVNSVRGGEVCFEASPRINWQKTAQRYFKEFALYRPDVERVRPALAKGDGRAVFEYPAELPFPKGFQRYYALGTETVHEVNPTRAIGNVTYRLHGEAHEVIGPWLSGLVCGPAAQRRTLLPDELVFVVATRPETRLERAPSRLAPSGRDGYELDVGEIRWRFYGDDLGGRAIERGFAVRTQPNGAAYYVAQLGPELPSASVRCRASWRIFELAAQPILRAQQNYGCS